MRVFLVRHGETRHNVDRRIQGPLLDDELNEHGVAQAAALEERFRHEHARGLRLAAVYSSPMKRAWMTAEALARGAGVDAGVQRLDGMIEFSWGIHLGKTEDGDTLEALKHAHHMWESGVLDYAPEGGESPAAAYQRSKKAFDTATARHAGSDIAVVAHGRINKVLLAGLVVNDLTRMDDYPQGNTSVTLLDQTPGGTWRVAYVNDKTHLKGLDRGPAPSEGPDSPLV